MKRFILYSYNFPPIGGAGAQRPLKFARYLRQRGWEAVVLTGPGNASGRWTPRDATLADEVPPDVEVERVAGPEPSRSTGWAARAERWLRTPTPWEQWWGASSVERARRIGSVDAVYTIMSPYESALPSMQIARERGCPWIADLGDPWGLDEMMLYPSELHRRLELRRMRRLLGTAAGIAMSTQEAAERVKHAFPELRETPIVVIPNGYDEADFEQPVAPRDDRSFRVVHTGYLHTALGQQQQRVSLLRKMIGGGTRGVEIITRSHVYLLEAVNRLLEDDPVARERLEIHFAGVMSPEDEDIARQCTATRVHGYLTHSESLALIRTADLLFLPMQNLPPGSRAGIVPGKTYEYLASGRPILGALPDGDARDILDDAGGAFLSRPDDVDAMYRILRDALHGGHAPSRKPHAVERFSYRRLSEHVAGLLDRVV